MRIDRKCDDCAFCKCISGNSRGIMDCDPDEYICTKDNPYFYDIDEVTNEDELDELYCDDFEDVYYYNMDNRF